MADQETTSGKKTTKPKYRLTAAAYINDTYLDPQTMPIDSETGERKPLIIVHEGIPGWHMEPWNDEARAIAKKHYPDGQVYQDPILKMAQI